MATGARGEARRAFETLTRVEGRPANSRARAASRSIPKVSWTARRSLATQFGGKAAISRASASAASRACPAGTTRLASPMRSASAAPTGLPVRIRSSARLMPISRASLIVPPSTSGTPHRRQKTPKVAVSSITRRSHQSASSMPPATAYPDTAAIVGLESSMRVGPMGPSPVGLTRLPSLPSALRSAPAQKVPPAPQSTAARVPPSASIARKASARARAVGPSTAFRLSGRSMMTVATAPCCSTRTGMALASSISALTRLRRPR